MEIDWPDWQWNWSVSLKIHLILQIDIDFDWPSHDGIRLARLKWTWNLFWISDLQMEFILHWQKWKEKFGMEFKEMEFIDHLDIDAWGWRSHDLRRGLGFSFLDFHWVLFLALISDMDGGRWSSEKVTVRDLPKPRPEPKGKSRPDAKCARTWGLQIIFPGPGHIAQPRLHCLLWTAGVAQPSQPKPSSMQPVGLVSFYFEQWRHAMRHIIWWQFWICHLVVESKASWVGSPWWLDPPMVMHWR